MSQSNSSEYGRSLFSEPRSAPDARMPPRDVGGPSARDNIPEFSVEELSGAIKQALERGFNRIRVRGEVSSVSRPGSGHIYLSFKQGRHVLRAVIWRSAAVRIATKPQEGIEYVATGRITSFSGTSVYQMVIERLVRSGEGEWLAMLEERKAKLRAEGLFDDAGKQKLPLIPKVVGVVSSPRGAAIQDILHRLRDRFPCHVLLWPVAVQGENCAAEVSAAIDGFNKIGPASSVPRPDVLIVARGGGSVEELFGFSEEIVVRAAHRSKIPLISAVGHETDTSLIDLAADVRAPTPTAAAELAVPVRSELAAKAASLDLQNHPRHQSKPRLATAAAPELEPSASDRCVIDRVSAAKNGSGCRKPPVQPEIECAEQKNSACQNRRETQASGFASHCDAASGSGRRQRGTRNGRSDGPNDSQA